MCIHKVTMRATDQTNIVQDNEELVDDEIPTKVLDQVKLVCRWRGNCKLCGPSNAYVITDVVGTSSNFSKHLTKVHGTNKDYVNWKVSQASMKKGAAVSVLPGQLTLASAFVGAVKCYERTRPKQVKISSSIVKNLVVGCGGRRWRHLFTTNCWKLKNRFSPPLLHQRKYLCKHNKHNRCN